MRRPGRNQDRALQLAPDLERITGGEPPRKRESRGSGDEETDTFSHPFKEGQLTEGRSAAEGGYYEGGPEHQKRQRP